MMDRAEAEKDQSPQKIARDLLRRGPGPASRLAPGEYVVDVAVHSKEGVAYDYQKQALALTVTAGAVGVGVYFPEHRWEAEGGVDWKKE